MAQWLLLVRRQDTVPHTLSCIYSAGFACYVSSDRIHSCGWCIGLRQNPLVRLVHRSQMLVRDLRTNAPKPQCRAVCRHSRLHGTDRAQMQRVSHLGARPDRTRIQQANHRRQGFPPVEHIMQGRARICYNRERWVLATFQTCVQHTHNKPNVTVTNLALLTRV
jgi:hypothetical protein